MQQRCDRSNVCIGHAPALGRAAQQGIGQRHNAHALVVGHEGVHQRERFVAGLPCRCEIHRFNEAIVAARAHGFKHTKIERSAVRRHLRCQRGGVGRDDEFVVRRAPQRQPRHALRRVLVGQGVVAAGIG